MEESIKRKKIKNKNLCKLCSRGATLATYQLREESNFS